MSIIYSGVGIAYKHKLVCLCGFNGFSIIVKEIKIIEN